MSETDDLKATLERLDEFYAEILPDGVEGHIDVEWSAFSRKRNQYRRAATPLAAVEAVEERAT